MRPWIFSNFFGVSVSLQGNAFFVLWNFIDPVRADETRWFRSLSHTNQTRRTVAGSQWRLLVKSEPTGWDSYNTPCTLQSKYTCLFWSVPRDFSSVSVNYMSPPLNIKPNGALIINGITSYATVAEELAQKGRPALGSSLRLETVAAVPTHFFLAGWWMIAGSS